MNDQYLMLKNLNQSANYSCKCLNKHGYDQSYLFLNILCKFLFNDEVTIKSFMFLL